MHRRLHAAYRALPLRHDPAYPLAEDGLREIEEHLDFLRNTLAATPPGTLAGARALARAILAMAGENGACIAKPPRYGYPDPEVTRRLAEYVLHLEEDGGAAGR